MTGAAVVYYIGTANNAPTIIANRYHIHLRLQYGSLTFAMTIKLVSNGYSTFDCVLFFRCFCFEQH